MSKVEKKVEKKEATKIASAPLFKVKKNLTLPLLKMGLDIPYYVKITTAAFLCKEIPAKDGEQAMPPVKMCNVITIKIAKLISENKDALHSEKDVKDTKRKFSESVKEKREEYKSMNPQNAESVEHFIDYIKAEILKEVDKKIVKK